MMQTLGNFASGSWEKSSSDEEGFQNHNDNVKYVKGSSYENAEIDSFPEQMFEREKPFTKENFRSCLDSDGRVLHESGLRRAVFKGAVDPPIRAEVWKLLFGMYPFSSTLRERQAMEVEYHMKYAAYKTRWKKKLVENPINGEVCDLMPPYYLSLGLGQNELAVLDVISDRETTQQQQFLSLHAAVLAEREEIDLPGFRKCIKIIDKDVPRTDRHMTYFDDEHSKNLLILRNILITYAAYNPDIGYVQGMNDILARFLVVLDSEPDAYWCFSTFMSRVKADFMENGMLRKIELVKWLLRKMDPELCAFMETHGMSDLLFCHRWLILSFKREFPFEECLKLFEIISSHHLELSSLEAEKEREAQRFREQEREGGNFRTNMVDIDPEFTFDLFVCVAVLTEFRDQFLRCTEIASVYTLVNSLSMTMNLDTLLMKAEQLFFQYCRKSVVDCFQVVDIEVEYR